MYKIEWLNLIRNVFSSLNTNPHFSRLCFVNSSPVNGHGYRGSFYQNLNFFMSGFVEP